jgi:hypothetical protein
MRYAWTQDLPITVDIYREIVADLGDEPAEGLVLHVAQVMPDGHVRYLDIWESEAACDRLTEQRLHPVVGRALARHQIRVEGGEPPRQPVHIAHLWVPLAINSQTGASPQPAAR